MGPLSADNSNANLQNYRLFKVTGWVGRPTDPPDAAVEDEVVYVSWNGATEVATWNLYGGSSPYFEGMSSLGSFKKDGFETQILLNGTSLPECVSVVALDSNGDMLGRTGVYTVSGSYLMSRGNSSYSEN